MISAPSHIVLAARKDPEETRRRIEAERLRLQAIATKGTLRRDKKHALEARGCCGGREGKERS